MKPYVVTFAGVPGSSKSIVAHHLSESIGLPILSTDNVRYEVREDLLAPDLNEPTALAEYERRIKARRLAMLERGRSFILDGSVDRKWAEVKRELQAKNFGAFVIAMELSHEFMINLYSKTGRPKAITELDAYLQQHQAFMEAYGDQVNVRITDEDFPRRLQVAEVALSEYIRRLS